MSKFSCIFTHKANSTARFLLTICLVLFSIFIAQAKDFVVVIDPGHGGRQPGTVGKIAKEKDINLAVALLVGKKIEDSFKDVKVVYTRKTDITVDLWERSKIANDAKGNLFISIHVNSVEKGTAKGTMVLVLGPTGMDKNLKDLIARENSTALEKNTQKHYGSEDLNITSELVQSKYLDRSLELATYIEDELVKTAGRSRRTNGVEQGAFYVLVHAAMPAVLVELDFICDSQCERFMNSADGQEKMAKAIFNGFKKYYNSVMGQQSAAKPGKADKPKADAPKADAPKSDAPKDKPKADNSKDKPKAEACATEYRVQILTSSKELPANSPQLKNLSDVDFYYEKNVYKYTVGHFKTEAEAVNERNKLRKRFSDCFVIRVENGKRVY